MTLDEGERGAAAPSAETILEQLPVAVFAVDRAGRPIYANATSYELLRGPIDDVGPGEIASAFGARRRHDGSPYPEADLPVVRALRGDRVVADDLVLELDGDGADELEVVAGPVVVAGAVQGAAAAFWRVNDRRGRERERELLASIVDTSEDAICSVDRDNLVTSWNAAAERMYGHPRALALGRPLSSLFTSRERLRAVAGALDGRSSIRSRFVHTRPDGTEIMLSETISVLRDGTGATTGATSIARDVTALVAAEADLAETRELLERNNRDLARSNRELEEFAYVAAHELSEPLRAVAGMVGLLERRYKGRLDADADEFIAFAVDGCKRMSQLIDDLLLYSRSGGPEARGSEIDLGELVRSVVDLLEPPGHATAAVIDVRPLPTVVGDRLQLFRVFQNIVGNALKFHRPSAAPRITVSAEPWSGGRWRISVADNGIGIEERNAEKIFGMFQQLHPRDEYAGTGMGLAIAERIIARSGGTIGVHGNEQGGSTFWFTLPGLGERDA